MTTNTIDTTNRIALARTGIAAKLGELQQRGARVRAALSPRTYLASPWVRMGIGVGIGYVMGRRTTSPATQPVGAASPSTSLSQMVFRSAVVLIAEAVVRRVLRELDPGPRS